MLNTTGLYCKVFRQTVLKVTLEDMSDKHVSLRAFENGRSSNINLLIEYENSCNEEQLKQFRLEVPFNTKE